MKEAPKPWTDEDTLFLTNNRHLTSKEAALRLGRPARTVAAKMRWLFGTARPEEPVRPTGPTVATKRYAKPFKEWVPKPHFREDELKKMPSLISVS